MRRGGVKKAPRKQFRVKVEKFTHKQFEAKFPDDAACLADIFRKRYPAGLKCPRCERHDRFTPIVTRRAYSCVCGFQVYPNLFLLDPVTMPMVSYLPAGGWK